MNRHDIVIFNVIGDNQATIHLAKSCFHHYIFIKTRHCRYIMKHGVFFTHYSVRLFSQQPLCFSSLQNQKQPFNSIFLPFCVRTTHLLPLIPTECLKGAIHRFYTQGSTYLTLGVLLSW